MRKKSLTGRINAIEKCNSKKYNRIMNKIIAFTNYQKAIKFFIKLIKKTTEAKSVFLINNYCEDFRGYSKKEVSILKKIYSKNNNNWDIYLRQGIKAIDVLEDLKVNNYYCYKIMKERHLKNIILIGINSSSLHDGCIIIRKPKDISKFTSAIPHFYNYYNVIKERFKDKLVNKKEVIHYFKPEIANHKNMYCDFTITKNIELLDCNKILEELKIKKQDILEFIPYRFQEEIKLTEAEILKMRNNTNVYFDLLIKTRRTKTWLRINGIYQYLDESNPIFLGTFSNITMQKRAKIKVDLKSFKRNKNLNDAIFHYNIKKDILKLYGRITGATHITVPHIIHKFKKLVIYHNLNNNEGVANLLALLSGVQLNSFSVKYNFDNIYQDYQIEATVIYKKKMPVEVIGRISNVTNKKNRELELIENAKYDQLTKLYNRETGMAIIKGLLEKNNELSLIVVDVDNFNHINVNYGNMFGNIILSELSSLLKELFPNDLIMRYGGDDFIIAIKGIKESVAYEHAKEIVKEVERIYISGDKKLSVCVGVIDNTITKSLDGMIKNLDSTILYIKECGGGFALSYDKSPNLIISKTNSHLYQSVLKNEMQEKDINDLVAFSLEILSKTKCLKEGLKNLLPRIGRSYSLQRITVYSYTYSSSELGVYCSWSNFEQDQSEDVIIEVSADELQLLFNSINYNGVLKIRNSLLMKLNGKLNEEIVRNSIHNQLVYHGDYNINKKYFVCFGLPLYHNIPNNCRDLEVIARIILTFLIREYNNTIVQKKSDFISQISHEIRTPLNGIIGMTRIAKNIADNPLKVSDSLGKIDMSSRYLLSLVNNILDISRIESDKMRINSEPFSLSNLLDDIQTLIQVQAEQKRINFNVIRNFTTEILIGDSLRISQVIVNLLGNAIKFTAEGGNVDFSIIEEVNANDLSKIQFIVKDSGIGIKKENTLKIFESFEQGSLNIEKQYGGSGLGLSISNSLVKLMGGELEVISEEGRGSEFFFTLVFYKGKSNTIVEKEDIHTITPNLAFIGRKVLLVEDDGLNAEFVQILLENAGFVVEVASNGKEAIEIYAKSKLYYYDFILMDIRMPVMDGKEATTYIRNLSRKDSQSIPIIAMTANAFEEDINESIKVGMNVHITKPIDMNVLYQELSKIFKDSAK